MYGTEYSESTQDNNWQERLVEERAELEHQLQQLNAYKDSLPSEQMFLLEKQIKIMKKYYNVLGERICSFNLG